MLIYKSMYLIDVNYIIIITIFDNYYGAVFLFFLQTDRGNERTVFVLN